MIPKISILMGIYNCADTLGAAIDSILTQTCSDWELIMCDDGSTDDTYAVAKRYCDLYSDQMTLLKNAQNRGLNHTLNQCLKVAKGEFIARMDGDDISLPERLEIERNVLESNTSIAVVSCPMIYFDESGEWGSGKNTNPYPQAEQLVHGTVHCHAPCMIRREAILAVGGYTENKKLLRVEDWHLWVKIYAAGYQGYNLPEHLYMMRDDRNAARRRKFRYRLNEAYVSILAVKMLRLPVWNLVFAIRPILVGLLPKTLYDMLHRRKIREKQN